MSGPNLLPSAPPILEDAAAAGGDAMAAGEDTAAARENAGWNACPADVESLVAERVGNPYALASMELRTVRVKFRGASAAQLKNVLRCRRRLTNRIAAKTSRDRRNAEIDEMGQRCVELRDQLSAQAAENAKLKGELARAEAIIRELSASLADAQLGEAEARQALIKNQTIIRAMHNTVQYQNHQLQVAIAAAASNKAQQEQELRNIKLSLQLDPAA